MVNKHLKGKKKNLFGKIIIVLFLVMIVLGFTIPGFIDDEPSQGQTAPRLCQTDADCYLTCDGVPTKVLCSQNICQQNSCDEFNYYQFNDEPLTFNLLIEIDGQMQELASRADSKDFFVKSDQNAVQLFSKGLSLGHVLEKVNIALTPDCIALESVQYCRDEEKSLSLLVNGEKSYGFSDFVPEEGDEVRIVYG